MKKALLLSLFLLLNGCSFESILALGEVDKVQVVKKNASLTHYRAYFKRTQLKPIVHHKKYLYFYNRRKKDLAILLHRYDSYYLYSIYHPHRTTIVIKGHRYRDIKRVLRAKGYRVTSPSAVAATSRVSLRRYKGIKTLRVEIKDYHTLQSKYKYAIKHYDIRRIKHLKTTLPHIFIASYYDRYAKRASTQEQKDALKIIAKKLHLDTPDKAPLNEEENVQERLAKEIPEETPLIHTSSSFNYYAQEASFHELDTYLQQKNIRHTLSLNQYITLQRRHALLKEEKILKESSLKELIRLYKTNKNPKYKKRILECIKEAQK